MRFSWLKYPLLTVITSLYFFPFEFTFLPGMNTKMLMAAAGLVWFIVKTFTTRTASLSKEFLLATAFALIVSLVGVFSVIYNNTEDYTYASYVVSFAVWMGGAYFVVNAIQMLHGDISPELMIKYLVAVCVAQCIIAVLIDRFPLIKDFVDSFLASEGFMGRVDYRLYGIGAALDVAGEKFGIVLIAFAALLNKKAGDYSRALLYLLWACFILIAIVGNMIGRTTTIGLIVALVYSLFPRDVLSGNLSRDFIRKTTPLITILVISIPLVILGYNRDNQIRSNIRFGFEGFFSLVETGHWETHSNNSLKNMVTFPDNTKTWVIGDGYFNSPESDPNFIGSNPTEYYKGTDIGYLRFIFYFGIAGLIAFALYFWMVGKSCREKFPDYNVMFLLVLAINYLVWFKVSTDIFVFFALFLCLPKPKVNLEDNTSEIEA